MPASLLLHWKSTLRTHCLVSCRVDTLADVRALWLHRLVTVPMAKLVNLLYGRLLPLHHLLAQAAAGQDLPEGAALSAFYCMLFIGLWALCVFCASISSVQVSEDKAVTQQSLIWRSFPALLRTLGREAEG